MVALPRGIFNRLVQPEIEQLDHSFVGHFDVGQPEIAMDDS
jgi:hypothetical protein